MGETGKPLSKLLLVAEKQLVVEILSAAADLHMCCNAGQQTYCCTWMTYYFGLVAEVVLPAFESV